MKLAINRNTQNTMFGGKSTYTLHVRAQLEGDEAEVIKKNSLNKEILVWHDKTGDASTVTGAVWKLMKDTRLTVDSFVSGTTFTCKNVAELSGLEDEVRHAALNLRSFIELARNFGGEEIINVDDELAASMKK